MSARAVLLWLLMPGFMPAALAAPSAATKAARPVAACVPSHEAAPAASLPATVRDCADAPELVPIAAGDFEMGDLLGNGHAYERPVRRVHVAAFLIGRYELTVAQWAGCVADAACDPLPAGSVRPDEPATGMSWTQAQRYLDWLSRRSGRRYRLPSEAEWEYAARAGATTQFSWGNDGMSCRYANAFDESGRAAAPDWTWAVSCDDGYARQAPVGRYPPNAWGLYDMLGNVWEWVEDCWHADYQGAPADARPWIEDGDCGKRVNRGGGWGNHPRTLRVSNRDADRTAARSDGLGFRVARDAEPER